jgi:hypothetical protein
LNHYEPFELKRRRQRFVPDSSRVITRFFGPGGRKRQKRIIQRVLSLSDEKSQEILHAVLHDFSDRHQDLEKTLLRHFKKIENLINHPERLTYEQKLLVGAFSPKSTRSNLSPFLTPPLCRIPIRRACPRTL